jgi:hypothetical protein
MARININFEKYDQQYMRAGLDRMEKAVGVLQMQAILRIVKSYENRRPPYKKGAAIGKVWTARDMDIMAKTIRVVRRDDKKDVRLYVGNFKTWWAVQMEFGRGGWKGGPKPFLRPAITASRSRIQVVLESGAGQTEK